MDRRNFLKSAATSPLISKVVEFKKAKGSELNCFIFSDAHIGFTGKDQPTRETQARMIQVIKKQFPNLDLVFDTGDVHHATIFNEERRKAREFWLQQMAGQFGESIFHYIPGNHELDRGKKDAEISAGELGSFNFRPYYSFDCKGIHFVSLPQLLDTIYITQESLNWLKQDLLFNSNKTTIIFSHNSLKGTTFTNGESGYRETVNSQEVMDVIDSHPQVLGWFHGHNHQYEVVKKLNRLYVSNGRIGGFNPPVHWGDFGQGHLGGIHLRVNENGIFVRAFSASESKFLDKLEFPNLSDQILTKTSYNNTAKVNYFFGHGKLANGVKHQIYNHYLTDKKIEIFTVNNNKKNLNENYLLRFPSKLSFKGKDVNRIMGFAVRPRTIKYESNHSGLSIKLDGHAYIKFPDWGLNKEHYLLRSGYYRCAAGEKYGLRIECEGLNGSESMFYQYRIHDLSHNLKYKGEYTKLKFTNGVCEFTFETTDKEKIPAKEKLYIVFTLKLTGKNHHLIFRSIQLNQVGQNNEGERRNMIVLNGKSFVYESFSHEKIASNKLFTNGTSSIILNGGNNTQTTYFQMRDVKWQIRNAMASLKDNSIYVHKMRSNFQENNEIILTPCSDQKCYIAKTRNLENFKINYNPNQITLISLGHSINDSASVLLMSKVGIKSLKGGDFVETELSKEYWVNLSSNKLEIGF